MPWCGRTSAGRPRRRRRRASSPSWTTWRGRSRLRSRCAGVTASGEAAGAADRGATEAGTATERRWEGRRSARPVQEAVEGFFASIAGLSHAIDRTLGEGDTLFLEGEVTYTRHDGSQIAIPFVDVFEYEGELIAEYRIYIDISPLYAD